LVEAPPLAANTADWQGWWDPAVASAMPAFNPTSASTGGAGPAVGGPPTNGYGNGSPAHSPTLGGLDPVANGHGASHEHGQGTNGHPTNGHPTNGHGANGHGTPAPPAASAPTDRGANPDRAEPRSDGVGSTGGRSYDPFFVSSLWGADGDVTLEPGSSTPTYHVSTGSPQVDGQRQEEDQRPRPSPSPRPLIVDAPSQAAVPEQRPSGPVDPVSGLRRRVPQSHLSAQLRTPEDDTPAPVLHRPSSADAAAALSRYQASRAAAQARVGSSAPTDPATTTQDFADGGHA
jgi:hypothetical protein